MVEYFYEDGDNPIYNRITVVGGRLAYNAVLDVKFTDEGNELITLTEVKNHLHIPIAVSDHDTELNMYLKQARAAIEKYTGLSLIQRTVTALLKNSKGGIELPYAPVVSVLQVYDNDDASFTSDMFRVDGLDFKTLERPTIEKVRVVYTAGYTGTNLPHDLKQSILKLTYSFFERSLEGGSDKSEDLKQQAFDLARAHRRQPVIL